MPDGTYEKGIAGEDRAIVYLQQRGMVLLCRRYRSPFGEIDIVMQDKDTLVFVEVKARETGYEGTGLMAVSRAKQRKIIKTAMQYLAQNSWAGTARFDVIELTKDGILHIANAFEATGF